MVENDQYRLLDFMENVLPSDAAVGCKMQSVSSKKRARLEMSPQTAIRADRSRDIPKQNEVLMLREALKSERCTLHNLYRELEEERTASMTAANEAMAMITRLQEEKAAVLMEARRYRRVTEERETHNQEAIAILKEALLAKEDDLLALQDLLHAYRARFMRMESSERGTHQSDYLVEDSENEQVLLLEGPENAFSKDPGQTNTRAGKWSADDGNSEHSSDLSGCSLDFEGTFLRKRYKEPLEVDQGIGKGQPEVLGNQHSFHCADTFYESQTIDETENDQFLGESSLQDASASIFARVKRLEERFEYLRQSQALDDERLNVGFQPDAMLVVDVEAQEISRPAQESAHKNRKQHYCMENEKLVEVPVQGEPEKVLKCLAFEGMDLVNGGQKQFDRVLERKCSGNRMNAVERSSFSDTSDDGTEGVHDVYEVHYEIKRPLVPPPEQDVLGSDVRHKSEMDMFIPESLQVCDKDMIPSNRVQPQGSTASNNKLPVDISSLDVQGVRTNAADEDVHQLKVRLQALEGERVFMKTAIDSLRKENKELKVLQELAQQLRDLKGDVRQTEAREQQNQLSLCSLFKGILSFTGLQNLAVTEGSRGFLRSSSRASNEEQGGLLHILKKASKTQRSVCITREHKVNFSST